MRNLPLYAGGFMGPFGATLVLPMFPELRTSFRTSTETIGWTFTGDNSVKVDASLNLDGKLEKQYSLINRVD